MNAHFEGLKELITSRFDEADRQFAKINGRVGKIEERTAAVEKDMVKVKTVWVGLVAFGGFAVDFVKHRVFGG